MPIESYGAHPAPAALRNLRGPLEMPNRSVGLPPVYLWVGEDRHPQRPPASLLGLTEGQGKTYVVFVDPSDEGKRKADCLGAAQPIPLGRQTIAQEHGAYLHSSFIVYQRQPWIGLIHLKHGDFLFARVCDGEGDPMDDILQTIACKLPYVSSNIYTFYLIN